MIGEEGIWLCPECGLKLYQPVSQCPRCHLLITPQPITPQPPSQPPSQPAVVQGTYYPEMTQKPPKEEKNVKRTMMIILVIVIAACLIIVLSYHFVIPRIELKVVTVYRESSGLSINVDSKLMNEGTLDIKHFSMNITVLNSSNEVVANGVHNVSSVDAHSKKSFDNIQFFGDQYEPYKIVIKIEFESGGKGYSEEYRHKVGKYMHSNFEDKFLKWGG
ncbi:MAG: hypothetical protein JSW00_13290 [Thermoplasmata archaeon]|nr:MAG: hypothetical protein JSW00_13290 [Thermoplasmata archaeon]